MYAFGVSHAISDLAAFTVIIGFGVMGGLNASAMSMSRSGIVKTIVQDATIYFVVIFTSHLVFVLTLVFARVSVRCNWFIWFLILFSLFSNFFPRSGTTSSSQS